MMSVSLHDVPGPAVAMRNRLRDRAQRAGVGHSVLHTWVRRADCDVRSPNNDKIGPMLLTIEAMGNALGLDLVRQRRKNAKEKISV